MAINGKWTRHPHYRRASDFGKRLWDGEIPEEDMQRASLWKAIAEKRMRDLDKQKPRTRQTNRKYI